MSTATLDLPSIVEKSESHPTHIGTRVFSHRTVSPFSREHLIVAVPWCVVYVASMILGACACFGGGR